MQMDGYLCRLTDFFYMRQTVAQSLQLIAIEDGPETGASMFNSPHLQNAWTNLCNFWYTLTLRCSEHICQIYIKQFHLKKWHNLA